MKEIGNKTITIELDEAQEAAIKDILCYYREDDPDRGRTLTVKFSSHERYTLDESAFNLERFLIDVYTKLESQVNDIL